MDILALRAMLAEHRLPLQRWGREGAKTVQDLRDEIAHGDCRLVVIGGTLLRCIRPLAFCVDGYHPDTGEHVALIEIARVFANGTDGTRSLEVSFAEKLNLARHERSRHGVVRAFREELSVELSADELRSVAFLGRRRKERESPSFPGLPTRMEMLYFGLTMPERHFSPRYVERQPDKTTVFSWTPYGQRPWRGAPFIRGA